MIRCSAASTCIPAAPPPPAAAACERREPPVLAGSCPGTEETIVTTGNHPFYVLSRLKPGFFAADELVPGDVLSLANGGTAVLVTIGSDTPLGWPALAMHAQLRAYAPAVGNHVALQAVTINAARYAFADRDLGSLEVGKIADLIMVRGNPLEDVRHAAAVEMVMKNGVLLADDTVSELLPEPRTRDWLRGWQEGAPQ
jgi:hypothetical protein